MLWKSTITAVLFAGCLHSTGHAEEEKKLYIYSWSEYTAPEAIHKFEQETGIKIVIDTFDSNETLLAKLNSGSGGFDVVAVSANFVPTFIKQDLLREINANTWQGYENIDPLWRDKFWDRGNTYTIPYTWGLTSVQVNSKEIEGPFDSLKLLFEPPENARGKVSVWNSPSDVIGLAELYLGMDACQTSPESATKIFSLLQKQASFVSVYAIDGAIDRQASGETLVSMIPSGDAYRARAMNSNLKFVFPKEGILGWVDSLAVPKDAPHPENAKKFLQFMLKPENSAMTTNFTGYSSPIKGAQSYYKKELKDAPELNVPDGISVRVMQECQPEAIKVMDKIWTRLRQ